MRITGAFLVLFFTQISFAQNFKYRGEIPSQDSSGYYKINLHPSIYNHLNKNKSDLRIYDSKNEEVPYLFDESDKNSKTPLNELPGIKFKQENSRTNKKTTVNIELPNAARISAVHLKISDPRHYRRFGNLSYTDLHTIKVKQKRKRQERLFIEISSDDSLHIAIPEAKVKRLTLEIENEDNPPLTFGVIEVLQRNAFIIAFLEKGEHYHVKFGNTDLPYPNYDLSYFKSKIPDHLQVAEVKNIMKGEEPKVATEPVLYKNKNFIWSAIFIVVVVLGFISIRMVREISK